MLYVFVIEGDNCYRIGVSPKDPDDMDGEEMDDNTFFVDEDYQHNTEIIDAVRAETTQRYMVNLMNKGAGFDKVMLVPYKWS